MKIYAFIGAFLWVVAFPAYAAPAETIEDAARHLLRTQISPNDIEQSLQVFSGQLALRFQADIQPKLGRVLLDDEKQQLQFFWYEKLKETLPYVQIENILVSALVKNLTLEELQEINRFNDSPIGKKFIALRPIISAEAKVAGMELAKKMADKSWALKVQSDLRNRFPQWSAALGQ